MIEVKKKIFNLLLFFIVVFQPITSIRIARLDQGLPVALSLGALGGDVALGGRVRIVQGVVRAPAVHPHRRRRRKRFVIFLAVHRLRQRAPSGVDVVADVAVVVAALVDDGAGVTGNVGETLLHGLKYFF